MAGALQETPGGNRLHIGVFGRTNSGKSSFINAFAGQEISIVADVAGTTTDPVQKAMEIAPLGPCVLIDTAGFDDVSELGARRTERTRQAAERTELAVLLFPGDVFAGGRRDASDGGRGEENQAAAVAADEGRDASDGGRGEENQAAAVAADEGRGEADQTAAVAAGGGRDASDGERGEENRAAAVAADGGRWEEELRWYRRFQKQGIPVLPVISKADRLEGEPLAAAAGAVRRMTGEAALPVSVKTGGGIPQIREALARLLPEDYDSRTITGGLCGPDDVVLLVMPQDIQAPKGRLILPQVQTIRELLDKQCIVVSVTTDRLSAALSALSAPPKLIVTDSQVFGAVYRLKPAESMLTSFSVLFAAYKGDLPYYIEGAAAIDSLGPDSRVLIAECCTHAPLAEDIGRVKLPRMLRKRFGEGLAVDIVSGTDFPEELCGYDLIIQCGACMFNRRYVLARVDRAKRRRVPMTNYGVAIAHLTGILDKVSFPGDGS